MFTRLLYGFVLMFPVCLWAQITTYDMPVAVVVDSFNQAFTQYNRELKTESELGILSKRGLLSNSLLEDATGITRSNGPGKVTTFTKHGLPSEHTKVTWNDIELNSPLNGIVDFSTLPSFLLSNRTNLFAQQPKEINLHSAALQTSKLDILLKGGSFNTFDVGAAQHFSIGNTQCRVGIQYAHSANDYTYTNDLGQDVQQKNGQYTQYHGLIQIRHRFSNKEELDISLLYSDIQTHIPPTIYEKNSLALQENNPLRWHVKYKKKGVKSNWSVLAGSNIESLRYIDPDLQLDATHRFQRHSLGVKWKKNIFRPSTYVSVDIRETYEVGRSDNFSKKQENVLSHGFVSISSLLTDRILVKGGLGIENGRDIWSPLQYTIDLTYIFSQQKRLTGTFKSLYRLPTYNELYWFPGGNTSLNPESGFAGIVDYFQYIGRLQMEFGASIYRLNDRILWQPNAQGIFSPINVGKIGSEEVYGGCNLSKKLNKSKLQFGLRYTFLHAHIIESKGANQSEGNILPFTPKHSISHHLGWKHQNWGGIKLIGKYQSKSYTGANNAESLEGFYTASLELSHTLHHPQYLLQFFMTIQNITNQTYYLANGYPQPGRNWNAGCYLKLNKKKYEN